MSTDLLKFYHENKCATVKSKFKFSSVKENEIKNIINSISSTAFGVDGISIQMLKSLGPYCISAVTHMLNCSLLSGCFPSSWKCSIVVPLPKTYNLSEISHFRPFRFCQRFLRCWRKWWRSSWYSSWSQKVCCLIPNLASERATAWLRPYLIWWMSYILQRIKDIIVCWWVSIMHKFWLCTSFNVIGVYYNFDEIVIQWFASYLLGRLQVTKNNGQFLNLSQDMLGCRMAVALGHGLLLSCLSCLFLFVCCCCLLLYLVYCSIKICFEVYVFSWICRWWKFNFVLFAFCVWRGSVTDELWLTACQAVVGWTWCPS